IFSISKIYFLSITNTTYIYHIFEIYFGQEKCNCTDVSEHFLSQYHCGPLLGSGGFGSVFSGQRLSDGLHSDEINHVPMQIAPLQLLSEDGGHPGVIHMLDWFEVEGRGFLLVMERPLHCQDLLDLITERGALSESLSLRFAIFHQVVEALLFIHSRGIVHMDIKDENIVVNTMTMDIKIVDFGYGALLKDGMYSEFQAPPEWIASKPYKAVPLTVWSLGVLLFTMVCGYIPFKNDDEIYKACPRFTRPVSTGCQSLIHWCLSFQPEDRPILKEILSHSWMKEEEEEEGRPAGGARLPSLTVPAKQPSIYFHLNKKLVFMYIKAL
uniref:non-specific serine/threonine protein kinase n=1 Tax=Maylandia zebra TaxID=106582 RepID=A0A3P9B6W0_9CICH